MDIYSFIIKKNIEEKNLYKIIRRRVWGIFLFKYKYFIIKREEK